jgi:nucleotide-binding universal stress UspA family protein
LNQKGADAMPIDRKPKKSRILLAVDGSEQSISAVRYIGKIFNKNAKIVLFHVGSDIPEVFKDMNTDRSTILGQIPFEIWKAHQEEAIKGFMEKGRTILIRSGFDPKAVELKVQNLKYGIARDIHRESCSDYDALVVGRTGVGRVDDIITGSVASKLVEVTSHIPIIVVGEHPDSLKILIALDGSEGSMKAVNFTGDSLAAGICDIMLCHVIRPLSLHGLKPEDLFISKHEADWIASDQGKVAPVIIEAKHRLIKAGHSEDRISREILTYQQSRAAAIVKAAADGGCGTIALGRRGFTSVDMFSMGRVSLKIMYLAYRPALWIVS